MFDAEISIDPSIPAEMLFLSLSIDQQTLHVTVSPKTRNANFLALLAPELGDIVAAAIDGAAGRYAE